MLCGGNLILCRLAKRCDASRPIFFALAAKFHLEPPHDVVRSSVARTVLETSFGFILSKLILSVLCLLHHFVGMYFIVHAY